MPRKSTQKTRTPRVREYIVEEYVRDNGYSTQTRTIKGTNMEVSGQEGDYPTLWIISGNRRVYCAPLVDIKRVTESLSLVEEQEKEPNLSVARLESAKREVKNGSATSSK